MKQILTLISAGALLFTSCTSAPQADNTTAEAPAAAVNIPSGDPLPVDVNGSTIGWVGTKQTGRHNGTFSLSNGDLIVENGQLKGGQFTINVASLTVQDLEGESKGKLEGHLKSADFFEVEKFPAAKFEITEVEAYDPGKLPSMLDGATHIIHGNLTLKDVTKNISFPARVQVNENSVIAQADFNIDRTEWNMNYKGPNNPADWFIKKEVNLKLDLKAGTL